MQLVAYMKDRNTQRNKGIKKDREKDRQKDKGRKIEARKSAV